MICSSLCTLILAGIFPDKSKRLRNRNILDSKISQTLGKSLIIDYTFRCIVAIIMILTDYYILRSSTTAL